MQKMDTYTGLETVRTEESRSRTNGTRAVLLGIERTLNKESTLRKHYIKGSKLIDKARRIANNVRDMRVWI